MKLGAITCFVLFSPTIRRSGCTHTAKGTSTYQCNEVDAFSITRTDYIHPFNRISPDSNDSVEVPKSYLSILSMTSSSSSSTLKYPKETPKHEKHRRRPQLFKSSNMYIQQTDMPLNFWNNIVPPVKVLTPSFFTAKLGNKPENKVDITVTFDDPAKGALELINKCGLGDILIQERGKISENNKKNTGASNLALEQLTRSLELYQNLVSDSSLRSQCSTAHPSLQSMLPSLDHGLFRCKARIVATRGKSGIKCPRWHVDHVPLRLIMSLEGPGVCYVDERNSRECSINRQMLNRSDEVSTEAANNEMMKHVDKAHIQCADTGEGIFLVGKAWEDDNCLDKCCSENSSDYEKSNIVQAAVHRSPDISPLQGRVLLTVDVIPQENENHYEDMNYEKE